MTLTSAHAILPIWSIFQPCVHMLTRHRPDLSGKLVGWLEEEEKEKEWEQEQEQEKE